MGLTTQYLRYQPCGKFNVIGSTWARIVILKAADSSEPLCAVGACEDVQLWNFRTAAKVKINKLDIFEDIPTISICLVCLCLFICPVFKLAVA
jgi:hypothetical protein